MSYPPLQGCPIYVHDAHAAGGVQLPDRYTPKGWQHGQYAVELWLQRALDNYPWRVTDPSKAKLIFVAGNFSLWCAANKRFSRRRLWKSIREDQTLWPSSSKRDGHGASDAALPMILFTSQYRFCGPPWDPHSSMGTDRPPRVLLLQDVLMGAEQASHTVISPFLVSKPPWLVGAAPRRTSRHVAWETRNNIFLSLRIPQTSN